MDRIEIKIVMHASKDAGEQIVTATETLLIPNLKVKLQQDYGIYFTGETEWQEAEGQVVGEFTLSGIEAVVHQYLSTGSIKKEG